MRIKATVTLNYDSDIMDVDHLTHDQFFQLVSGYALEDFNGGIEFDSINIDMEVEE